MKNPSEKLQKDEWKETLAKKDENWKNLQKKDSKNPNGTEEIEENQINKNPWIMKNQNNYTERGTQNIIKQCPKPVLHTLLRIYITSMARIWWN